MESRTSIELNKLKTYITNYRSDTFYSPVLNLDEETVDYILSKLIEGIEVDGVLLNDLYEQYKEGID